MSTWNHPTWIWCNSSPAEDEYGEFFDRFNYAYGTVRLKISADSQYAVYLNGKLAAQGQYPDYPHYKVYDEIDLTGLCRQGENRISFVVWYIGGNGNFSYYPGKAALAYELTCDGTVAAQSGGQTLCRMSMAYAQHKRKIITGQLGFSFDYDATKEDGWMTGELQGFAPAVTVEQELPMHPRPCLIPERLPAIVGAECIRISDTDIVYDLGKEYVGLFSIKVGSPKEQKLLISYGEHIKDGCVRQLINGRDFSVEYTAPAGNSEYVSPFRRLAGRYLEVHSETPLETIEVGLVPTVYPLAERPLPPLSDKQRVIYEMCAETLRLCMHEHYEDCPWREQGLYAMDSRNQMLCGYYAFGEYTFPKSNLRLISKDQRKDNLLSICYPMNKDFLIPSFSLHYITECTEYVTHSGDSTFAEEIAPKCRSILTAFRDHKKDGILHPFNADCYWNFYEWTDAIGNGGTDDKDTPDLFLNTLYSIALQNFATLTADPEEAKTCLAEAEELNRAILATFSVSGSVVLSSRPHGAGGTSELANSLAILCGAVPKENAPALARVIAGKENGMTAVSLSMMCFKYDALLKVDRETYAPYVIADIDRAYTPMIEFGSTTVWECEEGADAFALAGSLCHGWSAMPIYYYHKLIG